MIFVDLNTAFDVANIKVLLFKSVGVGVFLNILEEFLSNKGQRVAVDGAFSFCRTVEMSSPG